MRESEFGSDGQIHDVEKPDVDPVAAKPLESVDPYEASEPGSAAQRLRAFEDEHLGPDAVRLRHGIERGSGSMFQRMPIEKQKAHAAIEKTVTTEQKLAAAHAALLAAEAEHEAALAAAADPSRFGG